MTEPTGLFLLLSTVAIAAMVVAGTASTLWFLSLLRRLGLRLRLPRLSRPAAVPGYRNRRLPPCGSATEPVSTYPLVRLRVKTWGQGRRVAGDADADTRRGGGGKSAVALVMKSRATSVSRWLLLRA